MIKIAERENGMKLIHDSMVSVAKGNLGRSVRFFVTLASLVVGPMANAATPVYPELVRELVFQSVADWKAWQQSHDPKDYQRALFNIAAALNIDDQQADNWFLQGMIQAEMSGDAVAQEEALASFVQAISLDPTHHRARFMAGQMFFNLGMFDSAIEQFMYLADRAPTNYLTAPLLSQLAVAHVLNGRVAYGLDDFERLVRYNPSSAEARIVYATLLKHAGQRPKALAELDVILSQRLGSAALQARARDFKSEWQKDGR